MSGSCHRENDPVNPQALMEPMLKSDKIAAQLACFQPLPLWEPDPAILRAITPPAPTKPRFEFLDWRAISCAAEVMALNEEKHKQVNQGATFSDGWKKIPKVKHLGSLWRHLTSYAIWLASEGKFGEYHDPETGLPHLGHALCRTMFLLGIELEEQSK